MPQASDELRSIIGKYFGDEIDDSGPWSFLEEKGYTEKGGWIKPPKGFTGFDESRTKEYNCVEFLVQEWDYAWAGKQED